MALNSVISIGQCRRKCLDERTCLCFGSIEKSNGFIHFQRLDCSEWHLFHDLLLRSYLYHCVWRVI